MRGPDVVEESSMDRSQAKVRSGQVVAAMAAMVAFVFLTVGVAPPAGAAGRTPVLSFSSGMVTLTLPTQGCPARRPECVWMLFVNEPTTGKLVGMATSPGPPPGSSSAAVTVALPAGFCRAVQADALIGPSPWRKVVGRKAAVQTSGSCSLPFTGANPGTPGTSGSTVDAPAAAKLTQLPFTGIDVKPLTLLGASLSMLGLLMATDFDQRRKKAGRSKRRTWSEPAADARAIVRWFFGD
jgi:hypothetical protein